MAAGTIVTIAIVYGLLLNNFELSNLPPKKTFTAFLSVWLFLFLLADHRDKLRFLWFWKYYVLFTVLQGVLVFGTWNYLPTWPGLALLLGLIGEFILLWFFFDSHDLIIEYWRRTPQR